MKGDISPFFVVIYMRVIWFILLSLVMIVALASGTRSADVSLLLVKSYPQLRDEQLPMTLHYVGSTSESHIFMAVKTSFAGGRPFELLFAYRYPRQALKIENGWDIPVYTVHAEPQHCPRVQLRAETRYVQLLKDKFRYKHCLRKKS